MRKLLLLLGMCMAVLQLWAQTRTVTGKVTDDKGDPIPNASVQVKGTKSGVVTDVNGDFTIRLANNSATLIVSSVNYIKQEIPLTASNLYNIQLKIDDGSLAEVIVTGYGTRKKTEFTGAVSKVDSKKIEQVPQASIEQILQGRAAGLYVASGSGLPGSYARVNIRGVGSLSGGNDPLYVLDGVPVETGAFRTLNPNDFESVDILKDASGVSLYGSRGANGVIVITTKKGKSGKPQFQFRTQQGFAERATAKFDMMNTSQRLQFEANILGPANVLAADPVTGLTGYPGWDYSTSNPRYNTLSPAQQALEAARLDSIGKINTSWPDLFFRNANFASYDLNVSGGNQNINYYSSLGYYKQEGTVIRAFLDRYTFRNNLDIKADKLTVQTRMYAGWSRQDGIESENAVALANPVAAAYLAFPYEKLFDDNGKVRTGTGRIGPNAYDRLFTTTNRVNQFKGTLSITAIYNIWNGLAFRTTNGIDYRNNNTSRFIDPNSFAGGQIVQGQKGSYNEGNSENLQLITTTGLTYGKTFGVHQLNVQAMTELIKNKTRTFNATGFGLNNKLPNTPAATTAGSATNNFIPLIGGTKSQSAISSLFGVVDYNYNKKYSVSASIRHDAPSQVPETNRDNIFWSVGTSWNIIAEDFMVKQNFLQDLRLRASHGSAANANGFTSDFGYLSTYTSSSYAGVPGIIPASPGNEGYLLESQITTNVGLDLTGWDRRLRATFDWYNKDSRDLFVNQQLSRTTGFRQLATNAAKVRNHGIEVTINADVVSNKDWLVTIGGNIAVNKNKIVSLGQLSEFTAGTGIFRVGLPIGTHFEVGYLGVDPATGNPIYEDIDGKPTNVYAASNKRAAYGTFLPKYTAGANVDVRFKNIDASILFYTAQGMKRYNNERFFYERGAGVQYNMASYMLNAWQKPGDITDIQRAGSTRQFSSRDINDASFVRLRNVIIGYTFNFKNAMPFRGFRLYGQAQNLFTWTKWQGFDPEESNNIAQYEFPNPRTYTIGLDLNF